MAASALAKKLKLDTAHRAAILNAPDGYIKSLQPLPKTVEISEKLNGSFDWIQIFVKNQAEFKTLAPNAIKSMSAESRIWISFPKGSSKIQTDLTRDKGWDALKGVDLKWINLVSVNEVWSAFNLRTYKPGEDKQSLPWA
jgi:hypothetical protein